MVQLEYLYFVEIWKKCYWYSWDNHNWQIDIACNRMSCPMDPMGVWKGFLFVMMTSLFFCSEQVLHLAAQEATKSLEFCRWAIFVVWPFDSPNGGHLSSETVTRMGPNTRSRLEEPGAWFFIDGARNSKKQLEMDKGHLNRWVPCREKSRGILDHKLGRFRFQKMPLVHGLRWMLR